MIVINENIFRKFSQIEISNFNYKVDSPLYNCYGMTLKACCIKIINLHRKDIKHIGHIFYYGDIKIMEHYNFLYNEKEISGTLFNYEQDENENGNYNIEIKILLKRINELMFNQGIF